MTSVRKAMPLLCCGLLVLAIGGAVAQDTAFRTFMGGDDPPKCCNVVGSYAYMCDCDSDSDCKQVRLAAL